MPHAMSEVAALVDAMRLFLQRHEEALASGEPARGVEACEGIVEALGETLPRETARLGPTRADAVLARRTSELEGLAMQLKLAFVQLERKSVDVLRLVALLTATRRQIRALSQALALWAEEHGARAPLEETADDAMRAAREALLAGCADAASAAIAEAARRAGVATPPPSADMLDAWAALDETSEAIERKRTGRT